jgi:hypothetical protein
VINQCSVYIRDLASYGHTQLSNLASHGHSQLLCIVQSSETAVGTAGHVADLGKAA